MLAFSAHAEVLAVLPTSDGGQIRLTKEQNGCVKSVFAYVLSPDGKIAKGCWEIRDGDVFVRYQDGRERLYPIGAFRPPGKTTRRPTQAKGMTV